MTLCRDGLQAELFLGRRITAQGDSNAMLDEDTHRDTLLGGLMLQVAVEGIGKFDGDLHYFRVAISASPDSPTVLVQCGGAGRSGGG